MPFHLRQLNLLLYLAPIAELDLKVTFTAYFEGYIV